MEHPALVNIGVFIAIGGISFSLTVICMCIMSLLDGVFNGHRWL